MTNENQLKKISVLCSFVFRVMVMNSGEAS